MRTGRSFAVALALGLAACGGGQPEAPSPAVTPLGYSMPAATPVTYTSVDTARVNIEVQPGMPMEQTMGQQSTVRLAFAPLVGTAGNLAVTATYVDFSAFVESSMMGRQDVGDDALQGDFTLSLTPQGKVEQTAGPELPEEVEQLMMGQNMFADFFLHLPNRIVAPGESWTDTLRIETNEDGNHSLNQTIIVSTLRGDTTVAGRTLWVIDASKSASLLVEGNMQGMEMRNELAGTVNETSLWDPARRLLVSSRSSGTMTGAVSMPSAGMNDIPISVTNVRSVNLIESAD